MTTDTPQPMTPDLLPCPFCGSQPMMRWNIEADVICVICCSDCGQASAHAAGKKYALNKWNRRYDTHSALIEKLARALQAFRDRYECHDPRDRWIFEQSHKALRAYEEAKRG